VHTIELPVESYLKKSHSQDNTVSTVTHYGLDGPGSNPGGAWDFLHPSRPALGPSQPASCTMDNGSLSHR